MSCEKFSDSIDALIDGTLDPAGRSALDEHLASCGACRTFAADLRRIHNEAARLPRLHPPEPLWMKVRERLEAEIRTETEIAGRKTTARPATDDATRRVARVLRPPWLGAVLAGLKARPTPFFRPAALASAIVLLLALGAGYVLFRQSVPGPAPAGSAQGQPAAADNVQGQDFVQSVEMELRLAEQHYEKAIAGLELIAKADQSSLDPQVALVLQKNLGIIDEAIRESRVALQSQPTNQVAQASLFEAFRRKVALLQDTIALINEMRKGDQAGAARVLQNLNRG